MSSIILNIFFFVSSIFDFELFKTDFFILLLVNAFSLKKDTFSEYSVKFDCFKRRLFFILGVFLREETEFWNVLIWDEGFEFEYFSSKDFYLLL